MGAELFLLTEELWCEANIQVRGLAHPLTGIDPSEGNFVAIGDLFRLFGAVPSTGSNLYKLLARKEVALLYPGGVREAFKRRGERNMVLWPEQPEFVRMAIRHGATILPFAGIGGDDAFDFVFDTDEVAKLPFIGENMARDARKIQVVRVV
ncbi:hypothetical protein CBR_g38108 [Chara braunii]|uniref:Acyltransferase n=1 Tax=Chara braunii TaxID=69332 RepID=A0A388LPA9_CHABU|nr:hypothetical protein CBR_g38108 [Chara braunii]|eukprot:GBG84134.1 hypothetical protein CBR_g38108 [Chara braunii]